MRRRAIVIVSLFVLGIALAGPAGAESGEKLVRLGAVFSSPTGDLSESGQTTELDGSTGFFVGFEYGLTDLMSVDGTLSSLSYDIDLMESGLPDVQVGDVDLLEVVVSLNFQLLDDGPVSLFAGPLVGYAMWDDIESAVFASTIATDDEFVYGGLVGIDVPFGEGDRWSFGAALHYTLSDLPVAGGTDIGVDPLDVQVGVAYRF